MISHAPVSVDEGRTRRWFHAGSDSTPSMAGDDVDGSTEEHPSWWVETERLREELSLPPYEPSRFADDVYTYRVVERLEDERDCVLRFVAVNPHYPDDWEVRADGERLFAIGRHRDRHGNTVYEMDAKAFEGAVEEALDERSSEE